MKVNGVDLAANGWVLLAESKPRLVGSAEAVSSRVPGRDGVRSVAARGSMEAPVLSLVVDVPTSEFEAAFLLFSAGGVLERDGRVAEFDYLSHDYSEDADNRFVQLTFMVRLPGVFWRSADEETFTGTGTVLCWPAGGVGLLGEVRNLATDSAVVNVPVGWGNARTTITVPAGQSLSFPVAGSMSVVPERPYQVVKVGGFPSLGGDRFAFTGSGTVTLTEGKWSQLGVYDVPYGGSWFTGDSPRAGADVFSWDGQASVKTSYTAWDGGLSAPVQDAVIRVAGPATNVRVTDSSGAWVSLPDAAAGQWVRFEADTGRAYRTTESRWTGGVDVSGLVDFDGPRGVFEITPVMRSGPDDRAGVVTVTGGVVDVRGRSAHAL